MRQGWYNLLFAHWHVPAERLRPFIPAPLILDTFAGDAWLSITPFDLRLRPRGLPQILHFPEMNCRTYVTYGGKPGVFFFSLDAASRLAVWGARTFYHLPYFFAEMTIETSERMISYKSHRETGSASFAAEYRATGPVHHALSGTLEYFLAERYCLYTFFGRQLFRGEIHHAPWPLQEATAEIHENTIAAAAGISLPQQPGLLQYSAAIEVLVWPPKLAA
jgi:uncharacterized protein